MNPISLKIKEDYMTSMPPITTSNLSVTQQPTRRNKMIKALCVATVCVVLAACSSAPRAPYAWKAPFNEADFSSYNYSGKATVSGQAFLKTRGGDVKYGAGNVVSLTPATAFAREAASLADRSSDDNNTILASTPAAVIPKMKPYMRQTTADGNGNFSFAGLTAGDYYVECGVFWWTGKYTTGATVRKLISVKADEQVRVVLTE
jgi:hypothetical protein